MRFADIKNLPETHRCNLCGSEKPIVEMSVVYIRREKHYKLRPRCKPCHNERERGRNRERKTAYQRRWRARNRALNESYWKGNPARREQARKSAEKQRRENGAAIAIRRKMNKRGMDITIAEAKELLEKYGRCYPGIAGLTETGRRECERIRSRLRKRGGRVLSSFKIRLMVYEDGAENDFVIPPALQPIPYEKQAERGRQWQRNRRILAEMQTIL